MKGIVPVSFNQCQTGGRRDDRLIRVFTTITVAFTLASMQFSPRIIALALLLIFCGHSIASVQIYLPQLSPEPSEYGKVILDNHSTTGPEPSYLITGFIGPCLLHGSAMSISPCHGSEGHWH